VVLAATFLSYGIAEFAHGYGFLSVFIAARAGRALTKGSKAEPYENKAHHAADQIESVLLALILLWFGTFIGGTLWTYWTWMDLSIALAIILLIRPLAAWVSLLGLGIERPERVKIAFFGIRGMGSIYYMAFALTHAEFDDPERLWSILSLTILVSAIIHGSLSDRWMEDSS
jgi:NhaP-type Na+/H+ or K+/H+ antiporter